MAYGLVEKTDNRQMYTFNKEAKSKRKTKHVRSYRAIDVVVG
jgi:hypothetical protein